MTMIKLRKTARIAGLLTITTLGLGMALSSAPARAADSWTAAGWGGGGLYWAAAFHPTNPDVIYMGGDVAGVYKTEDAGKHWRLINNGLSNYAIYSLAIAPKNPDVLYAGTTSGLCKTTDGGKTWTALPETGRKKLDIRVERNKSVRSLVVDPTNSDIVYAGTPAGKIFKTINGGTTWTPLYQTPSKGSVVSVAISARQTSTLFAATAADGVVVSRDSGATWTATSLPADSGAVTVAPSDPKIVFASSGKEGLFRSGDAGKTWAPVGAGIDPKSKVIEVVVSATDPQAVSVISSAGWGGRFYASRDGGKTWTPSHRMLRDIAANPTLPDEAKEIEISKPTNLTISPSNPSRLFIAANWRTCLSDDGGKSWQERDRGADISVVYDVRFSGPRTYASVMDEGVLASDDAGANWRQLWPRKYDATISGHFWRLGVTNVGGTDRILSTGSPWDKPGDLTVTSDDGGKSFAVNKTGFPEKRPTANTMWGQGYLRALAPDPNNPQIVYAGIDGNPAPDKSNPGGGIFKSTDGGKTWAALPNQPTSRRMFFALAVDPSNSKRLYWGTCGPDGGLYRSDDSGSTWTRVFDKETWVFNVLVTRDGTIYCPGNNLWRSTDQGKTWVSLTKKTDGSQIVGLAVDPANEKTVWISSVTWGEDAIGGVQKTTDGGATWTDITGDLPYRKPLVLRFNPATRELWAAGGGVKK
jgi:photosystem II stability/assembly factor-like uncharacterized protein